METIRKALAKAERDKAVLMLLRGLIQQIRYERGSVDGAALLYRASLRVMQGD